MEMVRTRELWSLRGAFWALPISVEWLDTKEVASIRIGAGVRLLDIQREAAAERLKALGAEFHSNRWWLATSDLERFCAPEGEADPESVVEWRPPDRAKFRQVKWNRERMHARDQFFHEFAKTGWVQNRHAAGVLWFAFCKFMMHWLVNEQRAVDLGFCRLVA